MSSRRARYQAKIRCAVCETLERRQLLTVSLNTTTHVLTITGTSGADTTTLGSSVLFVTGSDNGTAFNFSASQVNSVVINDLGGADAITLSAMTGSKPVA